MTLAIDAEDPFRLAMRAKAERLAAAGRLTDWQIEAFERRYGRAAVSLVRSAPGAVFAAAARSRATADIASQIQAAIDHIDDAGDAHDNARDALTQLLTIPTIDEDPDEEGRSRTRALPPVDARLFLARPKGAGGPTRQEVDVRAFKDGPSRHGGLFA